jgi:cyclohexanone monooxygenase
VSTARNRQKYLQECTPGYYNGEGHVSPQVARNGAYSGGWFKYQQILSEWRESGELPGMEVRA